VRETGHSFIKLVNSLMRIMKTSRSFTSHACNVSQAHAQGRSVLATWKMTWTSPGRWTGDQHMSNKTRASMFSSFPTRWFHPENRLSYFWEKLIHSSISYGVSTS
jgi:hypothetical protein